MKPRVSIIVPVWNEEKFLEESLNSIRRQDYDDFEVIVVDDSSTDRSPKIIKYFETIDPRFRGVQTPTNSGTGETLNLGFHHARGEYLTWISGDSWVRHNFLQVLVAALDQSPDVVMVYSDFVILADGNSTIVLNPNYNKKKLQQECNVGPCWLFRAEAKKKAGPYISSLCEDYYMHLMLAEQGKMQRIPRVLGSWRDHPNNLTNLVSRKEGWVQAVVARAKARWNSTLYRVACISQVYTKESWEFSNLINRLGDKCALRHISSEQGFDLVLGRDDAEINGILANCHMIHLFGDLPEGIKVNVPILAEKWATDPTLVARYESKYENLINGTIRQQQSQPPP